MLDRHQATLGAVTSCAIELTTGDAERGSRTPNPANPLTTKDVELICRRGESTPLLVLTYSRAKGFLVTG